MQRITAAPRPDWRSKVEEVGLVLHSDGGNEHWHEGAHYRFSLAQVEEIEEATEELHRLCMEAASYVIERRLFSELGVPESAVPLIEQSWAESAPGVYGRFDFSYNGRSAPKLLEYNADTPTSLLEASVVQRNWLRECHPELGQFNSIHEKLVVEWRKTKAALRGDMLHVASVGTVDDQMTAAYMQDVAEQAGIHTKYLGMEDIGFCEGRGVFTDLEEEQIRAAFKLYPWEWMMEDEFARHLRLGAAHPVTWIEPAWKMLLSNKAIMAILWELNPGHPNLLPTYREEHVFSGEYVKKPLLSREGANVTIHSASEQEETGGDYGREGYVYQAFAPLPDMDGHRPVIGSWVVGGRSAGMGIREARGPITDNGSTFVPHLIDG